MENNAENKQLNIGAVSNCPMAFGISNRTYIGLGFMDRIRVLFGKEIWLNIDMEVDKEVNVLKTEVKITVAPFFKPKSSKTDFVQMVDKGCC